MTTTVLVAGESSPLVDALVRRFAQRGDSVRWLRPAPDMNDDLDQEGDVSRVEVNWGQVLKEGPEVASQIDEAMAGARVVVDATGLSSGPESASSEFDERLRSSVGSTRLILDASQRHRAGRVVHLADPTVLGGSVDTQGAELSEEDDLIPGNSSEGGRAVWSLPEAAFAAQMEVYRFVQQGVPAVIGIPGPMVSPDGPVRRADFLDRLADAVWSEQLPLVPAGEISPIDVRDVARSVVSLTTDARPGRRFVLAGDTMRLKAFLEMTAEVGGVELPERTLMAERQDQAIQVVDRAASYGERIVGAAGQESRLVRLLDALLGRDVFEFLVDLRRIGRLNPLDSERAVNEIGHRARPLRRSLNEAFERWNSVRSNQ